MQTATFLDQEINQYLRDYAGPAQAVRFLVEKYKTKYLELPELSSLCVFLIYCGQNLLVFELLETYLDRGKKIPWSLLAESLFLLSTPSEDLIHAIFDGADENHQLAELSGTRLLDASYPALQQMAEQQQEKKQRAFSDLKKDLMLEYLTLKSQNLLEEAERFLNRIQKQFPGDVEVREEIKIAQLEKASRLIFKDHRQSHLRRETWAIYDDVDPQLQAVSDQIETSMLEILTDASMAHEIGSQLAYDFALAHYFWESFDSSLRLLNFGPSSERTQWLRIEVLLKLRRFLEVLKEINVLQVQYGKVPEIIISLNYFKAISYFGLGQNLLAIEILESLVTQNPNYRNAQALLADWKGDRR